MGGCYGSACNYVPAPSAEEIRMGDIESLISKFFKTRDKKHLIDAHNSFFQYNTSGFFAVVAKKAKIDDVSDIPKEFPDIEYEVKFDIQAQGKGKEPSVEQYLDAFDFPAGRSARFLKDPVNHVATGVNHFLGDDLDEKLVIIEKGGKTYLKEKGPVISLALGVPFEEIVIKRTEIRYQANLTEILNKVHKVKSEQGASYRGAIRKEKGDAFLLDTNDGRIYSMTFTRAYLTKAGEDKESAVQRQLEIEYAGFIPGFQAHKKDCESQMVQGMVSIAKYIYSLYNGSPIAGGWTMDLNVTSERKYDFINGKRPLEKKKQELLAAEVSSALIAETPAKAYVKR